MSRPYRQAITCGHPAAKHQARGLCAACYQHERYHTLPAVRERRLGQSRAQRRAYYAANRDRILTKQKAYYSLHRETEIPKAVARNRIRFQRDPGSYQQMLKDRALVRRVIRVVARQKRETPLSELPRETPVGTPSDKNWWKVANKPRAWTLNL